jgi:hypothetical protein
MKWIDVNDRLPEDTEPVTACFLGWDDMQFIRVLEYDKETEVWEDWNCIEHTHITHWMPLPEPPKQ